MPELPEVETVRRGLERFAPAGSRIARVVARRPDLRSPLPTNLKRRLVGRTIGGYRRHGKYLLWDLDELVLVCHLGMSGTWRVADQDDVRLHDHVDVILEGGRRLTYHDPRRFGLIDLVRREEEHQHRSLRDLGPDALDHDHFTAQHLSHSFAGRNAAVKPLLLDQHIVAGIGNIYACEALFRSRIRPGVAARRLATARLERLVDAVKAVLDEAIDSGGSTLRDYRQTGGETGYFQHRFAVYGRDGQPCLTCGGTLRGAVMGGRATVWCTVCQRG